MKGGRVCGKWGKKQSCVGRSSSCCETSLPSLWFFCIWEKSLVEINFALKMYFSIYANFHSVFTIIIAEYCTPTEAGYHYKTKILVCKTSKKLHVFVEAGTGKYILDPVWLDQLKTWVFCLLCASSCACCGSLYNWHICVFRQRRRQNIVCKYIWKMWSAYQISGPFFKAVELDMFRSSRVGRCIWGKRGRWVGVPCVHLLINSPLSPWYI